MSPQPGIHHNSSHSSPLPPLTAQQLQVLKLLLEGHTVTAAAEQAGIHRTTIHHWCRTKPEFVHALDAARRNRHAILHDEMDRLAASAITVLEKTLADDSAPPALRVKGALAVLQSVARVSVQKPLLPRSTAENIEIENFLRTMENELIVEAGYNGLAAAARQSRINDGPGVPPAAMTATEQTEPVRQT
jgi:hypothetical protein